MCGKKKRRTMAMAFALTCLSVLLTGCEFVEEFFADGEIYKIEWTHNGENYTAKQAEDFLLSRGLFCGQTYEAYGSVNGEKARVHRVKFSKKSVALPNGVSASKSSGSVKVSAEMKFKEDTYEVVIDDEAYQWTNKVCTGIDDCSYSIDVSTTSVHPTDFRSCTVAAEYFPLSDMVTNIHVIVKEHANYRQNDGSYYAVKEDWRPSVMSYGQFIKEAQSCIRRNIYNYYKGQDIYTTDTDWNNKAPYNIIDFKGQGDMLADCMQKENTGGMSDVGAGFYLPAKIQLKIKNR